MRESNNEDLIPLHQVVKILLSDLYSPSSTAGLQAVDGLIDENAQ